MVLFDLLVELTKVLLEVIWSKNLLSHSIFICHVWMLKNVIVLHLFRLLIHQPLFVNMIAILHRWLPFLRQKLDVLFRHLLQKVWYVHFIELGFKHLVVISSHLCLFLVSYRFVYEYVKLWLFVDAQEVGIGFHDNGVVLDYFVKVFLPF